MTGGTALSRHFFNHRFSDDLDLFVNSDDNFSSYVKTLLSRLADKKTYPAFEINYDRLITFTNYAQIYLAQAEVELKVDLVNDVPSHFGEFESDIKLGKVDGWRNILSNEISALFRFEIKDYVDVWVISKGYQFEWRQIISEAKHKEAAVDPAEISNLFKSFPFESLNLIKWADNYDYSSIRNDFTTIAEDIFFGRKNSLG